MLTQHIRLDQNTDLYNTDDRILIHRAYEYAKQKHEGQMRQSGEPYISHPASVAQYLADLRARPQVIAAGLLHDVLEDTSASFPDLEYHFGFDIAKIVNTLSKSYNFRFHGDIEEAKRREEHHRFLETIKDIRSALIKLSDRYHNMSNLNAKSQESKIRNANETVKLYIPLARQIGLPTMERDFMQICIEILPKEEFEKSLEMSYKYEEEIEEKGYHQNKLSECLIM